LDEVLETMAKGNDGVERSQPLGDGRASSEFGSCQPTNSGRGTAHGGKYERRSSGAKTTRSKRNWTRDGGNHASGDRLFSPLSIRQAVGTLLRGYAEECIQRQEASRWWLDSSRKPAIANDAHPSRSPPGSLCAEVENLERPTPIGGQARECRHRSRGQPL